MEHQVLVQSLILCKLGTAAITLNIDKNGEELEKTSVTECVKPMTEEDHREIQRDWEKRKIEEMRGQGAKEWRIKIYRVESFIDLQRGLWSIRLADWLYSQARKPKR
jgi:hypothetical protein